MNENIIDKNVFFQTEITETGRAVVNSTWNEFVGFFPYYRVYYIADGEADIILSDKSMRLKKGNIYFIPAFSIKSVKLITETLDKILCILNLLLLVLVSTSLLLDTLLTQFSKPRV